MKKIIVAYDFTERADLAMQNALVIAKPLKAKIIMLHITQEERKKSNYLLKLDQEKIHYDYAYGIETAVVCDSIGAGIKQYAEKIGALLVILGSIKPTTGLEKIFGGQTLKIIIGGKTPFIVVRELPVFHKIKKVVLPINFNFTNKEKLRWIQILDSFFNINVEVFVKNDKNKENRNDIRANYLFAKRYLDRYNIKRKTTIAPEKTPFRESLVEHSHKVEADLIMIMVPESLSMVDYMIGADEEYVIANPHKIPVMCVNPNTDLMTFSSFF